MYIEHKQYTQQQCKQAYEIKVMLQQSLVITLLNALVFIKNKRLLRLDYCGVDAPKSGHQIYSDNASKRHVLNDYFTSQTVFTKDTSNTLP